MKVKRKKPDGSTANVMLQFFSTNLVHYIYSLCTVR